MKHLLNTMRRHAELVAHSKASMRLALVSAYDPNYYAAKVRLQPEDVETGWLPISALGVGNGWGIFSPPSLGDMVQVHFQEGDINAGIVGAKVFNDQDRPLPVPAGEAWLVHQSGSFLKLLNSGHVQINCAAEVDIGNVGSALHALVTDAFQSLFNGHTHGGGPVPDQALGLAQLTTILKAN